MSAKRPTLKKNKKPATSYKKWVISFILIFLFMPISYYFRYDIIRYIQSKAPRLESYWKKEHLHVHDIRNREILYHYMDHVYGIDLSHYQSELDWEEMNWVYDDFPLKFVVLRSTMGWNGKDRFFTKRWQELRSSKFVRGAYHFYRPDEPSTEQADNFIKSVVLVPGDLPPILDIETLPKVQSVDRLKVGLKNWLTLVEEHYGVKPIIYSGQHFYETYLKEDFKDYPAWIANYNHSAKRIPSYSMMWQFTEKGIVKGVKGKVDVNVFNGDWQEFEKWRIKAVRQ